MSVSPSYLEAAVTMAAVAREVGVDALVNMSQTTVSQMSIQNTTPSRQQRLLGVGEAVFVEAANPSAAGLSITSRLRDDPGGERGYDATHRC